jgi:hypothetical protein
MKLKLQPFTVELIGKWVKYNVNRAQDDIEHMAHTVAIFYGVPIEVAMDIDLSDLGRAFSDAMKKVGSIPELDEPKGVVTIKGKEFTFNKDLTKIKVGQVIDIKKMGDELMDRPAYLLAVLYDGDMSRKKKEELFKTEFPISEFLAVLSFFLQTSEALNNLIFRLMKEQEQELKQTFLSGGAGQTRFTRWRRTLIGMLTWLRICTTQLFYIGKSFSLKKRK